MVDKPYRSPIKVTPETLERAHALVAHVAQHGWSSLGLERADRPSLGAVVDAALALLEARVAHKSTKRK
jgi:hypothetical protein